MSHFKLFKISNSIVCTDVIIHVEKNILQTLYVRSTKLGTILILLNRQLFHQDEPLEQANRKWSTFQIHIMELGSLSISLLYLFNRKDKEIFKVENRTNLLWKWETRWVESNIIILILILIININNFTMDCWDMKILNQ